MFEAESARNIVLVKYEPPGMIEILPGCGHSGDYEFVSTTRTLEIEVIRNREEILERLPLKAAKMGQAYKEGDAWVLRYAIAGMNTVSVAELNRKDLVADCARATHYVRSMAVGAFELTDGAAVEEPLASVADTVDGGEEIIAQSPMRDGLIETGGDLSQCASGEPLATDDACRAIIRLYLEPIKSVED